MEQDHSEDSVSALLKGIRQKDMIEKELLQGRKRKEIIALLNLEDDIFDTLERNVEDAKSVFKRAEVKAFLNDLDFLRENLDNRNFNHTACSFYFTNRHGWSVKPNKPIKQMSSAAEVLASVFSGEIDVDVGIGMLKAITINDDIKHKKEDRDRLMNMVETLEKYKLDNNL